METRAESAARRLDMVVGRRTPKNALARFRAIVGAADASVSELVAVARQKLLAGMRLTPREWNALELMIRLSRPSLLVREGSADPLPAGKDEKAFPGWDACRQSMKPLTRSIGMILAGGSGPIAKRGVGTGFLAAPDVLITNAHVLDDLEARSGTINGVVLFQVEAGNYTNERAVRIQKTILKSPADQADLVALKLSKSSKTRVPSIDPEAVTAGCPIVAVGHPFPDEERNPQFVPLVFGDSLYLKHASLGEVVPARDKRGGNTFDHDCSTLGGNSGSPLFSMATGKVIGVHREGWYLQRNIAVAAPTLLEFLSRCGL